MFIRSRHLAAGAAGPCLIASCALIALSGCSTSKPKPAPHPPALTTVAPSTTPPSAPRPASEAVPIAPSEPVVATPSPMTQSVMTTPAPEKSAQRESAPIADAEKPKPAKEASATPKAAPVETTKPTAPAAPAKSSAAPAPAGGSETLYGTITLLGGGKEVTDPADMADTAVYYVPAAGAPRPAPGRFRIYTHGKQFEPGTLVVPVGSTVSFPNLDTILHNVFSVSPGATFDLGLLAEGKSADYTFTKTGTAFINCNVHQLMQANVLVIDTPYVTHPDNTGHFKLTGLPSGPGKVWTWNPRANAQALAVNLPSTPDVELRVVLVRPRQVQHLNKENKAY